MPPRLLHWTRTDPQARRLLQQCLTVQRYNCPHHTSISPTHRQAPLAPLATLLTKTVRARADMAAVRTCQDTPVGHPRGIIGTCMEQRHRRPNNRLLGAPEPCYLSPPTYPGKNALPVRFRAAVQCACMCVGVTAQNAVTRQRGRRPKRWHTANYGCKEDA